LENTITQICNKNEIVESSHSKLQENKEENIKNRAKIKIVVAKIEEGKSYLEPS